MKIFWNWGTLIFLPKQLIPNFKKKFHSRCIYEDQFDVKRYYLPLLNTHVEDIIQIFKFVFNLTNTATNFKV